MTITDVVFTRAIRIFGQTTSALPGTDTKSKYVFSVQSPFLKVSKHGFKPRYIPMGAILDLGSSEQPEFFEDQAPAGEVVATSVDNGKSFQPVTPSKKPGRKPKTEVNG